MHGALLHQTVIMIFDLLMKRKETKTEKRNSVLFDYITEQRMKLQQTMEEMPVTHQNEWKMLNDLFLKGIAQNSTV